MATETHEEVTEERRRGRADRNSKKGIVWHVDGIFSHTQTHTHTHTHTFIEQHTHYFTSCYRFNSQPDRLRSVWPFEKQWIHYDYTMTTTAAIIYPMLGYNYIIQSQSVSLLHKNSWSVAMRVCVCVCVCACVCVRGSVCVLHSSGIMF